MDQLAMVFMVFIAPIVAIYAMYQEVMDDEKKHKKIMLDSKEEK